MFVPPFSSEKYSLLHEMGREWYNYFSPAAKSIKKGSGQGRRGGGDCGGSPFVTPPETAAGPAGCVSTLLHLFDFHHLHFRLLHHQHQLHSSSFSSDDDVTSLKVDKGVVAPRNSLESDEIFMDAASSISFTEEDMPLSLSCTKNRSGAKLRVLVPSNSTARGGGDEFTSPDSSGSPGPRTPNLVARLMGLEVLPEENSSPPNAAPPRSSSSSSSHMHHLPPPRRQQSPLTAIRSSDVDGRRLSLQIARENRFGVGEFELRRLSCSAISTKRDLTDGFDESRSTSKCAKQEAKQGKENASGRRFGVDITNTTSEKTEHRKDEYLMSFKAKKAHKEDIKMMIESNPSEISSLSRSPRPRRVESKTKETAMLDRKVPNHQPNAPSPSPVPPSASNLKSRDKKTRLMTSKIQPKTVMDSVANKDELFALRPWRAAAQIPCKAGKTRKECKKPLLSASDDAPATESSVLPMKRMECSSSVSLDVPLNQQQPLILEVQATPATAQPAIARPSKVRATAAITAATLLSSSLSCNYSTPTAAFTTKTSTNTSCTSGAVLKYTTEILNRIGINGDTSLSLIKWLSPSHPMKTSVFKDLEPLYSKCRDNIDTSPDHFMRLDGDDKLPHDLVFEILTDTLRTYSNSDPRGWSSIDQVTHQSHLAERVLNRVESLSFHSRRVFQDIDTLVKEDLAQRNHGWDAYEEEVERIALEIQRDLEDSLLQELITHLDTN